jgi:hypothetical protein
VRRASKGAFRRTAYKVLIDLLLVCFVRMQSSCMPMARDHRPAARAAAARGRSLPARDIAREAPASRCRLAAFGPGPGLAGAGWRGTGR